MKNCCCFESYVCRNCRVRMEVEADPMIEVNERLANETARLSRNIEGLTGVAQALLAATQQGPVGAAPAGKPSPEKHGAKNTDADSSVRWSVTTTGSLLELKPNRIYRVSANGHVDEWIGMFGKATDAEIFHLIKNAGLDHSRDMAQRITNALDDFIAKRGLAD